MIGFFGFIVFCLVLYGITQTIYLWEAINAVLTGKPIPVLFDAYVRKLPPSFDKYLNANFEYYKRLPARKKKAFGNRVMKFIQNKNFETREKLPLTNEMKLMIGATAVKITFGLNAYLLPSFESIIIYPAEFFSPNSNALSKGETNARGVIVFSWKDFKFGYEYPNDSLNLGYHEFAHAIFIDHFKNSIDDTFSRNYVKWLLHLKYKQSISQIAEKHIFRKYASANKHEFFAVAVENFFERPGHFRDELPELYLIMTKMFNQDPLSATKHYDQSDSPVSYY